MIRSGAADSPTLLVPPRFPTKLGYEEGRNIAYQTRWAEGSLERLPGLAAELVALKLDVMLAASTLAVLAAKKATQTIPIVMTSVGDPVGTGLVDSLARPGGNITGNTTIIGEMAGKRLELLKQLVPHLSRVAARDFRAILSSRFRCDTRRPWLARSKWTCSRW